MILVDRALRERELTGTPIRVGLIGAGFMGKVIAHQIVNHVPGMELSVICARRPEAARDAYEQAGADPVEAVTTVAGLEAAIEEGRFAITDDAALLAEAEPIDAVFEVTGSIEYGARVVLDAIAGRKHVVQMNAELDGTLGPILKAEADRMGVVYSASDGDQPGVQMNLYRFVSAIGAIPLVCGNIKGLQDPYRTPATQEGFARKWGQKPHMVTSFADGTKISFEQATVANATGMTIAERGLSGRDHRGHLDELTADYDVEELRELGGIVDYVVGALPAPGVFVLATHDEPIHRHYLNLYKLGEGPLYSFYTPYHLCHFEAPFSLARAVLFGDAVMAPAGPLRVDVVATAKTDLTAGETIDGIGGFMTYGQCETAAITREEGLLPVGLAGGCRLLSDVPRDAVLRYDDVEVPSGRLQDELRARQDDLAGTVSR